MLGDTSLSIRQNVFDRLLASASRLVFVLASNSFVSQAGVDAQGRAEVIALYRIQPTEMTGRMTRRETNS